MFNRFTKSYFQIIDARGQLKGGVEGVFSGDMIAIDDVLTNIVMGDELRRTLPNGTEEAFEVVDPIFYDGGAMISAHFQVKIRRKGAYNPGTGGNYTLNVTGHNARVNWNSTDNSINTVNDSRVFADLRAAISENVHNAAARASLLKSVDEMADSANDKGMFLGAYQRFISTAAEHMTVIAPFLPVLAPFLG